MFVESAPGPVHNVSAGNILGPSLLGTCRVHTTGGKQAAAYLNREKLFIVNKNRDNHNFTLL